MFNPVELQLFPSCFRCLSWSDDGDLAIAAGEHVHILTPRKTPQGPSPGPAAGSSSTEWDVHRFRTNLFTNSEWPMIFPQKQANFSIGPEQSLSTVSGLAWSPPGLARHRRSLLAVLTSNLLLSLYEAVGQGKWKRVAVVNASLRKYFGEVDVGAQSLQGRKAAVRAFAWLPPLRVKSPGDDEGADRDVPGPEGKWGAQMVAVANDDNDVVLLQVERSGESGDDAYSFRVLCVTSLHGTGMSTGMVQEGSLFALALKERIKTYHVSCGPWFCQSDDKNNCRATGNLAVVFGSELKIIKLNVVLEGQAKAPEGKYGLSATSTDTDILSNAVSDVEFYGPLEWMHIPGSDHVLLAAGSLANVTIISFPRAVYEGESTAPEEVKVQQLPLADNQGPGAATQPKWEPISAMISTINEEAQTALLHLGTVGGYTAITEINPSLDSKPFLPQLWRGQVEDVGERFDLDHDLGGLAVKKIWGIASCHGIAAAAITLHPGDMVEYRTASEERATVVFSQTSPQQAEPSSLQGPTDLSPEILESKREVVLRYALFANNGAFDKQPWNRKLLYAISCCAIVASQNEQLRSQARNVLEWLSAVAEVDLTDEIAQCSAGGNKIEPKSTEEASAIFEQCEVCDAGIGWDSAREAQCANGHLFVRCGLSFLAIQEPGISKYCSSCGAEYLNDELLETSDDGDFAKAYRMLSNTFDTCVYCNGKFSA